MSPLSQTRQIQSIQQLYHFAYKNNFYPWSKSRQNRTSDKPFYPQFCRLYSLSLSQNKKTTSEGPMLDNLREP